MRDKLEKYINLIEHEGLRKTTMGIFNYEDFFTWPASLGSHHGYEKGLLIHTLEVIQFSLKNGASVGARKDILIASAVFHDVAKIWDYVVLEKGPKDSLADDNKRKLFKQHRKDNVTEYWIGGTYHALIHHINGSNAEFVHNARLNGLDKEIMDQVSHCILAHHGPVKEWRSPVAPQSREAVVLHQADYLSAHCGPTAHIAPTDGRYDTL